MEAARTIETSVITWHKRQDSTLNIYRRPNTNLQLIRCLRVSLSLFLLCKLWFVGIVHCKWLDAHYPRGRSRRSAAACLLKLWVRKPPTDMDVCLMWDLCVVMLRSLRRADHTSRGVLPNVVRRFVWCRNLVNKEALNHCGAVAPKKKMTSFLIRPYKFTNTCIRGD
jgi:hypothetical protein